jgi:hypothetical protein
MAAAPPFSAATDRFLAALEKLAPAHEVQAVSRNAVDLRLGTLWRRHLLNGRQQATRRLRELVVQGVPGGCDGAVGSAGGAWAVRRVVARLAWFPPADPTATETRASDDRLPPMVSAHNVWDRTDVVTGGERYLGFRGRVGSEQSAVRSEEVLRPHRQCSTRRGGVARQRSRAAVTPAPDRGTGGFDSPPTRRQWMRSWPSCVTLPMIDTARAGAR